MFIARLFVFSALLWASEGLLALDIKDDFLPMSKIRGLSSFNTVADRQVLPNFPTARNQRFNDCYAVAGAVIFDWYNCRRTDPDRANCSSIPLADRTMPLALSGLQGVENQRRADSSVLNTAEGYRKARASLNLYGGGSINPVLRFGSRESAVPTEKCFSYDHFAN